MSEQESHDVVVEETVVAVEPENDEQPAAPEAAELASVDADEPEGAAVEAAEESEVDDEPEDDLVAEGDVAADYLEALLDIADLDGDIDIDVENDRAAISVIEVGTGELTHLVGADGEVLAALQDLTRLAVARETGHRSRLMLDIAGHRSTRKSELQRIGAAAVSEVQSTGAPVRLAAMTAFERKVVHDVVADAGLTSESEGEEPNRYVVISPA